jgi:hypothetical protein
MKGQYLISFNDKKNYEILTTFLENFYKLL